MNKLIFSFVFLFAVCASVIAGAPTGEAVDGNYELLAIDTLIELVGDTAEATDDDTLFVKKALGGYNENYEYILGRRAFVASGDSVDYTVYLDAYDLDDSLIVSDSIAAYSAEAGEFIKLPINETIFGNRYTLRLDGGTDNGATCIFDRFYLIKRRIVIKPIPTGR